MRGEEERVKKSCTVHGGCWIRIPKRSCAAQRDYDCLLTTVYCSHSLSHFFLILQLDGNVSAAGIVDVRAMIEREAVVKANLRKLGEAEAQPQTQALESDVVRLPRQPR